MNPHGHLQNDFSYFHKKNSLYNNIDDVSIIVNKKKSVKRKHNERKHSRQPTVAFYLSSGNKSKKRCLITTHTSLPEMNNTPKPTDARSRSGHTIKTQRRCPFQSNFIVNIVSKNPFNYPKPTKLEVYRCQLNTHEDTCCCSCNSDAMFEVMKSLYDCYKKKNCDNCNCILCGHLQREERMLGEMRKSLAAVGLDTASAKERKGKIKKAEKALSGKSPVDKEKALREMAKTRQPLPEGKTPSEKALIQKIRDELGLPPAPRTAAEKARMRKAEAAGIITPLEGKTPEQKEKILKAQAALGIPLPEGRTPSEKALIRKIKAEAGIPDGVPSEKLRKARAAGLITPLQGKTPEQKEKILKGLAMHGIPLPEGNTPSEKKLIDKVRAELGLPPEPKTKAMKDKYIDAAKAGLLQPLEGKTPEEKQKVLQGLHDMGIPLPEGRTPSEKALIAKIKAGPSAVGPPSEKVKKPKGLVTPLKGKTPEDKEKILRGLAMAGIPLPEGETPSEKKLIDKVRNDLGLPIEPKTKAIRDKHDRAAKLGILQPLEGKTPEQKEKILQGLHDMGIPLPIGRTPSEKALIAKIMAGPKPPSAVLAPSEKMRRAKAAGLLSPLEGKTPAQKENMFKDLAKYGLPLPEGKTPSEKQLIDKVRAELGLPPSPTTPKMRDKHAKAADAGILQPLEGKSPKEKEKILRGLADMGIPLPEGRTPSEKALVAKIRGTPAPPTGILSPAERMRKAKAAGLLTPLKDKPPEDKEKILKELAMRGIPLPEAKTPSEKKLIDKVRADLGLPPDPTTPEMRAKHSKAADAGFLLPLEGKTPKEKEKILRGLQSLGIPLPIGRTPSEKSLIARIKAKPKEPSVASKHSERMRKAKAQGLLKPLTGQSPEQKENQLRALAMLGLPLPEGQTPSEKKLIDKVRNDLGVPVEPKTKAIRDKHEDASKVGKLLPLEGRTPEQKEKILQDLHDMGIPLPIGRTPSEKALIAKILAGPKPSSILAPSERMRRAKAAGLLSPLEGKTPAQKAKMFKDLGMYGLPLPEGKTPSEKQLLDKVRAEIGLPPAPTTPEMRDKHAKAAEAGILQPLEGKSPKEKEKILRGLADLGIPLPEGRTPSEKALIQRLKAIPKPISKPDRVGDARAAGLLTPLEGKSPAEKEKILRGLAQRGLPLPEAKTPSEKKLIDKVRADLGLPPEPRTPSLKEKHAKAMAAGLITPLEGKSPAQKEKVLRGLASMGIPLPEGRTPSEKALIAKIKGEAPPSITTDKIRKAKAAGLFTPLAGKTPEQKEKILKDLAKAGLPLPEGKTPSEKALVKKVKKEFGIPDRTPSEKLRKAKAAGLLTPLEGKTPAQKEKILRGRAAAGLPLPIGKTPSERALIQKIKDDTGYVTPSPTERLRKAKAAGLITPLKGKSPSVKEKILKDMIAAGVPIPEGETPSEKALINRIIGGPPPAKVRPSKAAEVISPIKGKTPEQREKALRGLVKAGMPLPEPKSASEKDLIDRIRKETGLPPEPDTPSLKEKYKKAQASGLITPLEGKTPAEKQKILKKLHDAGIPLPEGRTPSEKSMINKIKRGVPAPKTLSEKLKAAKAAGLMTPLEGKTPAQKEKILRGLAKAGLPLPEGKTPSEKDIINKIRNELGLPPEPKTPSLREKMKKAQAAGIITPLEGKTPEQKRKILKALANAGIPLPEGRTPSEKSLIAKVKAEAKPRYTPSEKQRKAKAAGLLTPLTGKSPAEKEKIMRGLAELGLPLPETKTDSEKKLAAKIRKEFGLPPKSRPPSEGRKPRTPSEKLRKAKAAGLLTPLAGKTPEQKEKIMRGLAQHGLPLPEATTPSEKKLAAKIRKELGLPPEPETPSMKQRHEKAAAAGVLVPLEGLSPAEKEKVLRAQADLGLPLPEGRTPSEKSMIAKIKAEHAPPKVPSEKLRKAKAAGLITPLEGKSPAEKEKILRGLAEAGLPLPEGKTPSEKSLIHKIRTELGLPPPATTPSEKSVIRKAKAAGLFTPLTGKSPAEKERILKGLAEAGLPLPLGKTPSEKALIKKVRAEAGLPPEPTPSEKIGKIKKTRAKKVGAMESKGLAKGIEAEKFQDVMKTTTCDRGCGCDKKKIRFKHSYVKIRVTSPDISSFCSCPDECIPGVKAGAFIDNEGIKVTVGSAIGTPLYSSECSEPAINADHSSKIYNTYDDNSNNSLYKVLTLEKEVNKISYILNTSNSDVIHIAKSYSESENVYLQSSTPPYEGRSSRPSKNLKRSKVFQPSDDMYKDPTSKTSFDSIFVLKTDTSLSLYTNSSDTMDTISMTSDADSNITDKSTHSGYQTTYDLLSLSSLDGSTSTSSASDDLIEMAPSLHASKNFRNPGIPGLQREYTIFRMSQKNNNNVNKYHKSVQKSRLTHETDKSSTLPNKIAISRIMEKILTKKRFSDASSIFIVLPTSDDNDSDNSTNALESVTSLQSTATYTKQVELNSTPKNPVCGKGKKFYMQEITSHVTDKEMFKHESLKVLRQSEATEMNFYRTSELNEIVQTGRIIDPKTTAERSCCCQFIKSSATAGLNRNRTGDRSVQNVMSRPVTPFFQQGKESHWFRLKGRTKTKSACDTTPNQNNSPSQNCCCGPSSHQNHSPTKSPCCSSHHHHSPNQQSPSCKPSSRHHHIPRQNSCCEPPTRHHQNPSQIPCSSSRQQHSPRQSSSCMPPNHHQQSPSQIPCSSSRQQHSPRQDSCYIPPNHHQQSPSQIPCSSSRQQHSPRQDSCYMPPNRHQQSPSKIPCSSNRQQDSPRHDSSYMPPSRHQQGPNQIPCSSNRQQDSPRHDSSYMSHSRHHDGPNQIPCSSNRQQHIPRQSSSRMPPNRHHQSPNQIPCSSSHQQHSPRLSSSCMPPNHQHHSPSQIPCSSSPQQRSPRLSSSCMPPSRRHHSPSQSPCGSSQQQRRPRQNSSCMSPSRHHQSPNQIPCSTSPQQHSPRLSSSCMPPSHHHHSPTQSPCGSSQQQRRPRQNPNPSCMIPNRHHHHHQHHHQRHHNHINPSPEGIHQHRKPIPQESPSCSCHPDPIPIQETPLEEQDQDEDEEQDQDEDQDEDEDQDQDDSQKTPSSKEKNKRHRKTCPCPGEEPKSKPKRRPKSIVKSNATITEIKNNSELSHTGTKKTRFSVTDTEDHENVDKTTIDTNKKNKRKKECACKEVRRWPSPEVKKPTPKVIKKECACDVVGPKQEFSEPESNELENNELECDDLESNEFDNNVILTQPVSPKSSFMSTLSKIFVRKDCACNTEVPPTQELQKAKTSNSFSKFMSSLSKIFIPKDCSCNTEIPLTQKSTESPKDLKTLKGQKGQKGQLGDLASQKSQIELDTQEDQKAIKNQQGQKITKKRKDKKKGYKLPFPCITTPGESTLDCKCKKVRVFHQPGQDPKTLESSESDETPSTVDCACNTTQAVSPKGSGIQKITSKLSKLYTTIRKSLSKQDCGCNTEILGIQKEAKKEEHIVPQTKQLNDVDRCECNDPESNKPVDDKVSCKCKDPESIKQAGESAICKCIDSESKKQGDTEMSCKCPDPETKKESPKIPEPTTEAAAASQPAQDLGPPTQANTEQIPPVLDVPTQQKIPEPTTEAAAASQPAQDLGPPTQANTEQIPPVLDVPTQQKAQPVILKLPPEIMEYPSDYGRLGCGWVDTGKVMKIRSEMALEVSGFKVCKKRKRLKPQQQEEPASEVVLNFEDAIKYYTRMNPDRFQDLLPPQKTIVAPESKEDKLKKAKEAKKLAKAEAKKLAKAKAKAEKKAAKEKKANEKQPKKKDKRSPEDKKSKKKGKLSIPFVENASKGIRNSVQKTIRKVRKSLDDLKIQKSINKVRKSLDDLKIPFLGNVAGGIQKTIKKIQTSFDDLTKPLIESVKGTKTVIDKTIKKIQSSLDDLIKKKSKDGSDDTAKKGSSSEESDKGKGKDSSKKTKEKRKKKSKDSGKEKGKDISDSSSSSDESGKKISKKTKKKKKVKIIDTPSEPTSYSTMSTGTLEDDYPSLGFKLVIGGNLSGIPGGFVCFDMIQESYVYVKPTNLLSIIK